MNRLPKLLTPFNLKILEMLIDENISVRDLAKKIKCSPAKITQFIKLFKKDNLIKTSKEKNKKILILNKENPVIRQIISLLFIDRIVTSKTFSGLKKNAKSIGVYGSVVEGSLDKKSDIDLWVLSDIKTPLVDAGNLRIKLSEEIGREVSIKFFTPKDINNLKKKDEIFYNEIEYKSKIIYGEGF
ncbi:MAG: nucleotidyltransferase domain-containing protein [Candidatus Diapherotrites archaeon]